MMPPLPALPALAAGHGRAVLLDADGVISTIKPGTVARQVGASIPLAIHVPATLRRLGNPAIQLLDLLELFAFVHPAQSLAPTPAGMARALEIPVPTSLDSAAQALPEMAELLLTRLAAGKDTPANRDAPGLAARMGAAGWLWAPYVLAALGQPDAKPDGMAMRLWKRLPKWEEVAPRPPPSSFPITPAEARTRLASLLGPEAEQRPAQADFCSAATAAFAPREVEGSPQVVLAEAGTGTGKTMGYLAPASLWATRNKGAVWVSTYTRHLQRQIEQEAQRLPAGTNVVLRKGRENYLCLLNFEDAMNAETRAIPLGLIARWAAASADGDLFGGDLPGWFAELYGQGLLASIADRRGECIHAACPHFSSCVIERVIRNARQADLVIANHALVMAQSVWGGLDDDSVPTRYVFDEGHHIFDAADSAFAIELSGTAMAELRRWLLGPEGTRSRARGLAKRLEDMAAVDEPTHKAILQAVHLAKCLPAPMFSVRLDPELAADDNPAEALLRALRAQSRARATEADLNAPFGFETDLHPLNEDALPAARKLSKAMALLRAPLVALRARMLERLETEPDLEEAMRQRLESTARSLKRRAIDPLSGWGRILDGMEAEPAPGERPARIEFLRLDREAGTDKDIALLSHLLDPTEAFTQSIAAPAHGLLITSATLRDGTDMEEAWENAEARTGAAHLAAPAIRAAFDSPFDYGERTRVVLVSDINTQDLGQLAGAYKALFEAAGGGGLGLFTAISRLRAVHAKIAAPLEEKNIPLYAQHVDAMDNATLVDIFRAEEHSCLLGTDAMRDGVDIPGNSLRLVVFERTPWPRPDILHRTRRTHLSHGAPKDYDDAIVRLRLRQAFGRLIRRADDRGVFVLLDRAFPSRLLTAFPEQARIIRSSLSEAVTGIGRFLREEV
ncbi:ATP-dependent DNA helicase [Acidocella facilis]|uniref:ATP-dependent DNA helicase n=1 Tax=Acidocella facilis TaxID=525 RepID=UPI001F3F15BB|nr:ATP-dependent DNA helicase [Acidocella facilis]